MAREFIEKRDSLNQGREKLNRSITRSYDADTKSDKAIKDSGRALINSQSVREELNQVVISGDSSVEAAQARVDAMGGVHTTLKKRVDRQEFVVSKTAPPNTAFWFEDRGDSGLQVSTGSGISVQNAIVSDSEIDDKTKLWFDK